MNRKYRKSLFWALIFVLVLVLESQAGIQKVLIKSHCPKKGHIIAIQEDLRKQGFAQAIIQEIEKILSINLSSKRRQVLLEFLQPDLKRFILSYTEKEFNRQENICLLNLWIKVNERSLRYLLKRWGTYYTSQNPWDYCLNFDQDLPEAKKILKKLELFSGLERRQSGYPCLTVRKTQPGLWAGTLETKEHTWKTKSPEIQKLWLTLWSKYFDLPKVKARTVNSFHLSIEGWSSVTGLEYFDHLLSEWSCLDQTNLIMLDLRTYNLQGKWTIDVLNQNDLVKRLNEFTRSRNLKYEIIPLQ